MNYSFGLLIVLFLTGCIVFLQHDIILYFLASASTPYDNFLCVLFLLGSGDTDNLLPYLAESDYDDARFLTPLSMTCTALVLVFGLLIFCIVVLFLFHVV